MILIIGAPRSGTSWLAKIFDSHPDVVYRHEPDIVARNHDIPFFCEADQIAAQLPAAAAYLRQLVAVRQLKAAGSLPVFPKSYHSRLARLLRLGCIYGVRALERLSWTRPLAGRLAIPDFTEIENNDRVTVVLKTVSALGRTQLFTRAVQGARTILIIRHPCGHIASVLQGRKLNKLAPKTALSGLAATGPGRRHGLSADLLAAMPAVEQLAWHWSIANEIAMRDAGADIRVVRYEDLCADPLGVARDLFAFTGQPWHQQTTAFLRDSTVSSGQERYFSVRRDPKAAAEKWRQQLSPEDIQKITAITEQTMPGRLFVD